MKNRLDVLEQIADLAEVPPEQVAPECQFLLEVDFSDLVLSHLDRQVYWVAAMKAAIKGGSAIREQSPLEAEQSTPSGNVQLQLSRSRGGRDQSAVTGAIDTGSTNR